MRRRLAPPIVPLALATLALAAPVGAAPDAQHVEHADDASSPYERYSLRAELGPEYDTNAHRTEVLASAANSPVVRSALARAVLTGTLSDVVTDGHFVALSATAATKVFYEPAARSENVAIAESSALWRASLGARTALTLSGAYYEAFQRAHAVPLDPGDPPDERRDFRSLTPTARLSLAAGPHVELGLAGGYRWFTFKPDRDFDFQAPTAGLDLRWARETADGAAEWEAALRVSFERRTFGGPALERAATCTPMPAPGSACPPAPGTTTHADKFLMTSAELARTGRLLLGGGYAFHYNASNSFGESVMRHFVTARLAAALPFEVYLVARAELLFASYAESLVVGSTDAGRTFLTIEDENRSNLRVDLSRNLTDRLQLIARYSFYATELNSSSAGTYRRQTALLSLSFTLEK